MKKILSWVVCTIVLVTLGTGVISVGNHIGTKIQEDRFFANLPESTVQLSAQLTGRCPLCTQCETNGPCIINLMSGTIQPTYIYDTNQNNSKKIDGRKTHYGSMKLQMFLGLGSGYCMPDEHYARISIDRKNICRYSEEVARQLFCADCMSKIAALGPTSNVLFADCYDMSNVALYKLEDVQKSIEIWHYTIVVDELTEWSLNLKMTSSFFSGGSELDE